MRISIFVPLVVVAFLSACGSQTATTPYDDVPHLSGQVDLTIGSADGTGPDVFGRIGGVLELPDGRIVVSDLQANEIRVFDESGEHAFTFGREGEGPGDLAGPCCLALDPNGLVWTREARNGRYSAFEIGDRNATFVRSVRQQHGAAGLMAALTFDAEGRLVDVGERVSSSGEGSERVRFHLESSGAIGQTDVVVPASQNLLGSYQVERETADGRAVFYLWQPYGSHSVSSHGYRGRWARALTGTYEVVYSDGASVDTLFGSATSGPPLTDSEREAGEAAMGRDADRVGVRTADLPYDLPDRKTPIQQLFYDALGRLWVELSVPPGEDRKADVWDVNGTLAAHVSWPADVRMGVVSWISKDRALGVARDELGVERVVRIRFQ